MPTLINIIPRIKKAFLIAAISYLTVPAFAAEAGSAVVINPQTLKNFVLSKNVSLMIQMNQVEQAKMKVNVSRGNLLPSISLGAAISSGSTFGLSTISMLMPFLFPSNWLDLKQSYHLLNAQTKAYQIAKLNTLASAYSTYLTVVSDLALRNVLQKQLENYQSIEEYIRLGVQAGLRQESELFFAHAQTSMAAYQVSQLNELLVKELSLLRYMLGLPLTQDITIAESHPKKSPSEHFDAVTALKISVSLAPEFEQLNYLERAAKAAKWSQAFAFLNTGTLSKTQSSSTGAWNPAQINGSASIGFSYYPNIQLNNLQIEQIKLQKSQMTLQQAQLIESVLGSLAEAQKQVAQAAEAETSWNKYYDTELLKFRLGLTDLLHVLNAANNLTAALTNKIKSQNDLDNQRVILSRLLINDEFRDIQPCVALLNSKKHFERNGFKPSDKNISVEKFCDSQKAVPN